MQLVSTHQTYFVSNTQHQIIRPVNTKLMMTLPPEILGEIFSFYIHSPSPTSFWDESCLLASAGGSSPFPLTHICSYWRNVVLNTPTLWSSLYIENPTPEMIPQVQTWMERAGDVGLRLTLRDWLDSEMRGCDEGTKEVLRIFTQRSSSWRNINFVLEFKDETVFNELDKLPNLEEVQLIARYWNRETLEAFWTKVHQSSSLRQINWLRTFNFQQVGLPRDVPWRQLHSITASCAMSDEDVLFILQACPELVRLNIQYSSWTSTPLSPDNPIVQHDRLEIISLHYVGNATLLFNHVSLPALQGLYLINECEYDYSSTPSSSWSVDEAIGKPVEECFKRSPRCRLRELVIQIYPFEHGVFAHGLGETIQRLLDLQATRDLEFFDVYPLSFLFSSCSHPTDLLHHLAKHPARCVREVILNFEKERFEIDRHIFVRRQPMVMVYQEAEEDEVENHEALVDVDVEFTLDCSEFAGPSEI